VPRGPIKLLLGPAVSQIAGAPTFLAKLRPVATQRFNEVLGQQFRRFGKQL
jgi:hypothetical protein